LFRKPPRDIRKQAYQAYRQFEQDPFHPSLQIKESKRHPGFWSARISVGYWVMGIRHVDEMTWVWIGSHREYEQRF
jgi:hypothetical protein